MCQLLRHSASPWTLLDHHSLDRQVAIVRTRMFLAGEHVPMKAEVAANERSGSEAVRE